MPTERPGSALHEWARPPYDVVWFSTARSYEWLGRPDLGPTIVDLDNLEDVKAGLRAELLADQLRSTTEWKSLWSRLAWYQVRLNGSDWRRFQRSVAAQVERVVIASDLDAVRSGLPNVTVIPNTYPRPTRPVGRPHRRQTARGALPGKSRIPTEHRRGAMAGDGDRSSYPGGSPFDGGAARRPTRLECHRASSARSGDRRRRSPFHGRGAGPGHGGRWCRSAMAAGRG